MGLKSDSPTRRKAQDDTHKTLASPKRAKNAFCELSAVSVVLWFSITVFLIQVLGISSSPILLIPENMQGPVSVARNIRHLPCISRRTGEEGVCMFAIDCLKSNGSHLGTCIDRFYFGSCCQVPHKSVLVPITGNNIEDNTIEGSISTGNNKETPEKEVIERPGSINDVLKPEKPEHKTESDEDVKKTTVLPQTTSQKLTTQSRTTEIPFKLSTFQTVDVGTSDTSITSTSILPISHKPQQTTKPQFGTKRPQRPVPKPTPKPVYRPQRPGSRPNATRPFNTTLSTTLHTTVSRPVINSTSKPKPTKPVASFNVTRRPLPYKPPPKRPAPTKRPAYQPPRLNITFISQSSTVKPGSKPTVTNRPHVTTITYINTTSSGQEEKTTTEKLISTTVVPKISTTTTPLTTLGPSTESPILSTETPLEDKKPLKTPVVTEKVNTANVTSIPEPQISVTLEKITTSPENRPVEVTEAPEKLNGKPELEKIPISTKSPEPIATSVAPITEKPVLSTKHPEPTRLSTENSDKQTEPPIITTPIVQTEKTTAKPHIEQSSSTNLVPEIVTVQEKENTVTESVPQRDDVSSPQPEKTKIPEKDVITEKVDVTEKVQLLEKSTEEPSSSISPTIKEDPKPELSTEYPSLVTWSSNVDTATKSPEPANATAEESWSPITPPEGWILISTVKPTASPPSSSPESSSETAITTPSASASPVLQEDEIPIPEIEKPISENEKPVPLTEKPVTVTEKIDTITELPDKVSEKPAENYAPELVEIPATITEKPIADTEFPIPLTEKPSPLTEQPVPVTEKPVAVTEKLVPVTEKPVAVTEKPEPITEKPVPMTEKPVSETEKPVRFPENPVTVTETTITEPDTSEATVAEFTVNVTLTPTVPSSTESMVLSTVSSENVTESATAGNFSANGTTASGLTESQVNGTSVNATGAETSTAATQPDINMTNFRDVCGRRLWPEARIVGGAKSGFGRWPWQISLRQFRTSTYLHKCGAALLNENWAITAAHCVEHVPPSELLVRLGEHDLAHEAEPYGFAERRVQIVASHPHFDPATFEYDLALLRFYEPVTFQPNILPVCVPDNDDNFVGKTAYVTGWGRLYDEGPLPSVLQEVSVPVINNTACEAMYRAAGYNEHIPNIFICAGWKKGGFDSCEGDSGGPMVVQRADNRFVLGGVISWGIGCAEPNQPGVYTRISEFRDWINQILQF